MGLFSNSKVRRESSDEKKMKEMSEDMRASGSATKVRGGVGGQPEGSKRYKEEDFVNYIQRVGKMKTSTPVIRGIVSKQLKATPNIQMDEMLRRVKRQLL